MATRSLIAYTEDDKTWNGVYCHSDGYLEYTGSMLAKHYTTPEAASELIKCGAFGGLRFIPEPAEILGESEWFYDDEPDEELFTMQSKEEIAALASDLTAEYAYCYSATKQEWESLSSEEEWDGFIVLSKESIEETVKQIYSDSLTETALSEVSKIFSQDSSAESTAKFLSQKRADTQRTAM